jgi:hypothetical protein
MIGHLNQNKLDTQIMQNTVFGKAPPNRRADAACPFKNTSNRGMITINQAGNLVQCIAFLPAIPHQGLVRFGVVKSLPVIHRQHPPPYTQTVGVASTG